MSDKREVPYLAPGCFGSALLFRRDDMVCNACPFQEQCEPAHEHSLALMREKLGIPEPKERAKPRKEPGVVPDEPSDRLTLPKKVRDLLARLDRASLDVAGGMRRGENPFIGKKGFGFMAIAAHMIMRFDGPVTHSVVAQAMMKKKDWRKGTADAHARMAIQALEHVGAVENTDGVLSIKDAA